MLRSGSILTIAILGIASQLTAADLGTRQANLWLMEEWSLDNPTPSQSNRFDVIATATFSHQDSGETAFALIGGRPAEGANGWQMENGDPNRHTFAILDAAIQRAHGRGMQWHIWAWGDQARGWVPHGGVNGAKDVRLQRYIAARLGPLPGWTMGYGFDLEEWAHEDEVNTWARNLHEFMGWDHLLMARRRSGNDLDVLSNDSRLGTNFYDAALSRLKGRPVIFERRFTYRRDNKYDMETTRRAFWQFTMASGAAAIWGHYPEGCSAHVAGNYPSPEQLRTHRTFWLDYNRFQLDLNRASELSDGLMLANDAGTHYIAYKEATGSVQVDLSNASGRLPTIAVDCKAAYAAIDLGTLSASSHTIDLPHSSDWAIAIGDFGEKAGTRQSTD